MTFSPSRRQFVTSSGLVAAGLVTGCRSNNAGTGTGASASSEPSLVEVSGTAAPELSPSPQPEDLVGGPNWTPADLSGQTLTLWGLNYAPHVDRYKKLAAQFKTLTGADVKVQPQDEPAQQLLTAIAGKNPPDVICLMGRMSDQLVKQKALLALDDVVYGDLGIDMNKWWLPDAIQAYEFSGAHYGVPLEAGAVGYSVTGRTDLIRKAGTNAKSLWPGSVAESDWPTKGVHFNSYEELWALAAEVQQKKGEKISVWGQNRQGWEMQSLISLMWQQDAFWWDGSSGTFNMSNDACVKAIDTMVTIPYEMKIESRLAVGNVVNGFVAKQVALAIGNISCAGQGSQIGIKGETVIAPSIVDGKEPVFVSEGGWGFEVPVQAKNRDAGIEFARFLTTYEAQFIYSQIYGGMAPACRALINSTIFGGDTELKRGQRRILPALQKTRYQGNGMDPQMPDIVAGIIDLVRNKKNTSSEASTMLQKQLTDQQKRYAR